MLGKLISELINRYSVSEQPQIGSGIFRSPRYIQLRIGEIFKVIVDLYFGELTPEQVRLIVVFFRGIVYQYEILFSTHLHK